MLISLLKVTSWFDTVNNAVTRWMNFRETICMIMTYNYSTTIFRSIFAKKLQISGSKNLDIRVYTFQKSEKQRC